MTAITIPDYKDGEVGPEQERYLRHLAQWVGHWYVWGLPGDEGKARKIPRAPRGTARHGDTSNPATAGTLDEALQARERLKAGGVGALVSSGSDGLVGIDLDGVVSDGVLNELAREAVTRFRGCYIEVSPSGTGLRIFALGQVPAGIPTKVAIGPASAAGKSAAIELYASGGGGRFLRCTGVPLSADGVALGTVGGCQPGVDWLVSVMSAAKSRAQSVSPDNGGGIAARDVDGFARLRMVRPERSSAAVLESMKADATSKPRSKLAAALAGQLSPWKGDHSAADLFLCIEACQRGCGSAAEVEAVWCGSALSKRAKWRRADYRERTIHGAAEAAAAKWDSRRARALDRAADLAPELADAVEASGDKLVIGRGGALAGEPGNVIALFRNHPAMRGLVGFNALEGRPVRLASWRLFDRLAPDEPGPLSDSDLTRLSAWLRREFGMSIEWRDLTRAILASAEENRVDPLADRLNELAAEWDGKSRLKRVLVDHAQADDTSCAEFVSAAGQAFFVGAVARVFQPGCKHDTVLVLEGTGGGGKSGFFRVLADAVLPNLFTDSVGDLSNAQSVVEGTDRHWIVEIAELAGIRRAADVEALKASITRQVDGVRRPYARDSVDVPRRFVLAATTNRSEYLHDPSGALARRFWPVRVRATESAPINLLALAEAAPQLWGEAVHVYRAGARWWLDAMHDPIAFAQWERCRDDRREVNLSEDLVIKALIDLAPTYLSGGRRGLPLREIARKAGDFAAAEGNHSALHRLADVVRALGLEKRKDRTGCMVWHFTDAAARDFLERRAAGREEATVCAA